MTYYQVCCFGPASAPNTWGAGNPSAVIFVDDWPSDDAMKAIAAETQCAVTTFVRKDDREPQKASEVAEIASGYQMRWFIPGMELPMCGMGSLTAGHGLLRYILPNNADGVKGVSIYSPMADRSLVVLDKPKDGNSPFYTLTMPINPIQRLEHLQGEGTATTQLLKHDDPALDLEGLGAAVFPMEEERAHIKSIGISAWFYLVVVSSPEVVQNLKPDLGAMKQLHHLAVVVTAATNNDDETTKGFDFVSRFFSPKVGQDEDHACASSHCTMFPYWGKVTGKTEMRAKVLSSRGGEFKGNLSETGDEVALQGTAVTFLKGELVQKLV